MRRRQQSCAGAKVSGIVGVRDWARGLEAAWDCRACGRWTTTSRISCWIAADLTVPDGPGQIVPLADAPGDTVKAWMLDYQLQTLHTPRHRRQVGFADSRRPVCRRRKPCRADAGRPGSCHDRVQCPNPQHGADRRRLHTAGPAGLGYARRAVALHLAASGAGRATLFSASEAAARAYRAIGFRQIGDWTLMLLCDKERVRNGVDQA